MVYPIKTLIKLMLAASLVSLVLVACGDNTATSTTGSSAISATPPSTPSAATTKVGSTTATTAGAVTTAAAASSNSAKALTDLGKNLTDASDALKKNDLAAAKAAYKKFDEGWENVEDAVKDVSPDLYEQLEDAMTPVGRELLRSDTTTVEKVTPLLKELQDKYNSAIATVEKGKVGS